MRRLALALTSVLLTVAACSEDDSPTAAGEPGGRVTGVVATAAGQPVAGAQVFVLGSSESAFTDSTGAYRLDRVDPGSHTLVARLGARQGLLPGLAVGDGTAAADTIVLAAAPGSGSPEVVWTYPTDSQEGGLSSFPVEVSAPVSSAIQVRFSHPMDRASIEEAVELRHVGSGRVLQHRIAEQGGDLFGVFPLETFAIAEEYSLSIGAGARNAGGEPLAAPHTVRFVPEPVFEVEWTFPISGETISPNSWLKLGFNTPVDLASVAAAVSVDPAALGVYVAGYGANSRQVELQYRYLYTTGINTPLGLEENATYTLTVSEEAADVQGNPLAMPYAFSFHTAGSSAASVYQFYIRFVSLDGTELGTSLDGTTFYLPGDEPEVRLVSEMWTSGSGMLDELAVIAVSVNGGEEQTWPIRKNRFSGAVPLEPGPNRIEVRMVREGVATYAESHTIIRPGSGASAGLFVDLSWSASANTCCYPQVDLDLHLIGPDGSDCYYGNPTPDWGVEGNREDDPALTADQVSIYSFETAVEALGLARPPAGTYQVKVHFYDAFGDTAQVSRPRVTVVRDGQSEVFSPPSPLRENDVWEVTSFTVGSGKPALAAHRRAAPISRASLPDKPR